MVDKDDYKAWYEEAMIASNEAGFVGMSAAETIHCLASLLQDSNKKNYTPLTEEQIRRIDDSTHFHESFDWNIRFARAIERWHGIGVENSET